MTSNAQADLRKVSSIFESFDIDKDAKLSAQELKALIQQCNPSVTFTDVQLQAIVGEVNTVSLNQTASACFVSTSCIAAMSKLWGDQWQQCAVACRQVLEQYEGSADAGGLTRQSLAQLYLDRIGDCDLDFATLQLAESKVNRNIF
jgi:hypothetical protein